MEPDRRKKFEKLIQGLTSPEDIDEVSELLRRRWDQVVKRKATCFQPGDRVEWTDKGEPHRGEVVGCNVKTIDIEDDASGRVWRVTATALRRL